MKVPSDTPFGALANACFNGAPAAELEQEVRAYTPISFADPDPENRYWDAALLTICGKRDVALRLLKSAIEGHYCAYSALQKDPLLAPLRGTQEFNQLLSAAKECENKFRADTGLVSQ
jgi:hypothetical protein